jgi:hypothetical protein
MSTAELRKQWFSPVSTAPMTTTILSGREKHNSK